LIIFIDLIKGERYSMFTTRR